MLWCFISCLFSELHFKLILRFFWHSQPICKCVRDWEKCFLDALASLRPILFSEWVSQCVLFLGLQITSEYISANIISINASAVIVNCQSCIMSNFLHRKNSSSKFTPKMRKLRLICFRDKMRKNLVCVPILQFIFLSAPNIYINFRVFGLKSTPMKWISKYFTPYLYLG